MIYNKNATLNPEAVRDAIPALFELFHLEEDAGVRAVLGHFIFVYVHPYMDRNGRIGRFLFNTMLASGGYSRTVIPVEQRDVYMAAQERASVDGDIQDFARFLEALVEKGYYKITSFLKNEPSGFSKDYGIKPFIPKPEELASPITQASFKKT